MKFAELSQEVLIARQQQVRFDIGLTPGRRKMNYKEKFKSGDFTEMTFSASIVCSL